MPKWLRAIINFFSPKKKEETKPEPIPEPEIVITEPETEKPIYNPRPNRDPNKPVVIVDVYHHDNVIDWKKIAEFADAIILKVSEAESHEDTDWRKWRIEAHKVGLLVGFYHFYRSNKSPEKQAAFFCNLIQNMQPGEFCATCDFETEDDPGDGFDILEVERFNQIVESKLGTIPWIYGGRLLKENVVPERFKRYPLWLSHYTSKPRPVVPKPWEKELLWQFTESAKVPGIENRAGTDLNRFNGTYEELLKMCVH